MISLETLGDGSAADRNFLKLARIVLDTGGVGLSIRVGTSSVTWTASTDANRLAVPHGLGKVPVLGAVFNADATGSYGGIASFLALNLTATTFDIYGRTPAALTGTKAVFWVVIG